MGLDDYVVNVDYLNRILNQRLNSYLPLSGGIITGTPTIKKSSPALKLINTNDNSTAYIQLYQKRLRMGYSSGTSLAVDQNGNVGVVGGLTAGGNISAAPATDGKHTISLR
jgi:hypothetical protein